MTPKMSCLEQPCSALADTRLWLPLWSHSISYLAFSFLLLLSVFPNIIVFTSESCLLMICPKYANLSFAIFGYGESSNLICSRTHLFIFLVVQDICKTVLQNLKNIGLKKLLCTK